MASVTKTTAPGSSPPGQILPAKLLHRIFFQAALGGNLDQKSTHSIQEVLRQPPWTFARVCSQWRTACQEYGDLWAQFDLHPRPDGIPKLAPAQYPSNYRDLISLQLQRSKTAELLITISPRYSLQNSMIQLITPHLPRCSHLSIPLHIALATESLTTAPSDFPSLKSIELVLDRYTDWRKTSPLITERMTLLMTRLQSLPSLSSISTRILRLRKDSPYPILSLIPTHSVTRLVIHDMEAYKYPNEYLLPSLVPFTDYLVELDMTLIGPGHDAEYHMCDQALFPNLRTLRIRDDGAVGRGSCYIQAPGLKVLEIESDVVPSAVIEEVFKGPPAFWRTGQEGSTSSPQLEVLILKCAALASGSIRNLCTTIEDNRQHFSRIRVLEVVLTTMRFGKTDISGRVHLGDEGEDEKPRHRRINLFDEEEEEWNEEEQGYRPWSIGECKPLLKLLALKSVTESNELLYLPRLEFLKLGRLNADPSDVVSMLQSRRPGIIDEGSSSVGSSPPGHTPLRRAHMKDILVNVSTDRRFPKYVPFWSQVRDNTQLVNMLNGLEAGGLELWLGR